MSKLGSPESSQQAPSGDGGAKVPPSERQILHLAKLIVLR
jgi:hypothetical protein